MLDIILKSIEIILILFIVYFIIQGRKNDLDKNSLSFFILGLIFLLLTLLTDLSTYFGVSSLILKSSLSKFYLFLTPACFFIGSLFLRKKDYF